MTSRSALARNLRLLRNAKGVNQETLADMAGLDRSYLSDLENERSAASLDTLDALAQALGVDPRDLIDRGVPGTTG